LNTIMENSRLENNLNLFELSSFHLSTLTIESGALANNPLGDSSLRRNPVMMPTGAAPSEGWPVVLSLSGFTGNGPNTFNLKNLEPNIPQVIDACVKKGEAPKAIYVFCDAMTFWGGSQFINSEGMGRYEDYILDELLPAIETNFTVTHDRSRWCVTGGSSGGYGALHLATCRVGSFGVVMAIAPDSFFEASLLGDIRTALPTIEKLGGVRGVYDEMIAGKFMKRKDAHTVLNAIAMGLCYAGDRGGGVHWPIDTRTGLLMEDVWLKWKAHDPLVFLRQRPALKTLNNIYLDVGKRDEFQLQYGARQINGLLEEIGLAHSFTEFDGGHFELSLRRPEAWKWLKAKW
jgi:enterochelin esterase-like enzyme